MSAVPINAACHVIDKDYATFAQFDVDSPKCFSCREIEVDIEKRELDGANA